MSLALCYLSNRRRLNADDQGHAGCMPFRSPEKKSGGQQPVLRLSSHYLSAFRRAPLSALARFPCAERALPRAFERICHSQSLEGPRRTKGVQCFGVRRFIAALGLRRSRFGALRSASKSRRGKKKGRSATPKRR
jgi:hypothetical protein